MKKKIQCIKEGNQSFLAISTSVAMNSKLATKRQRKWFASRYGNELTSLGAKFFNQR